MLAVRLHLAIGRAAGAVEEYAIPGIAEPRADGAEPFDLGASAEMEATHLVTILEEIGIAAESSPSMPDHWKSASTPITQLLSNW